MNRLLSKIKDRRGAASYEVLIALTAWFGCIVLVINVMFILATMTIAQGSVNRGAQRVAALGCLTPDIEAATIAGFGGLIGGKAATLTALTPTAEPGGRAATTWERNAYIDSSTGRATPGSNARSIFDSSGDCSRSSGQLLPAGALIYLQLEYSQPIPFLGIFGVDNASVQVRRGAMVSSQSLEVYPR